MKVLIDTSSLLWGCLMAGKDKENGYYDTDEQGREHFINTAQFGFDNASASLNKLIETFGIYPKDMIFVRDGEGGKNRRTQYLKSYKGNRDKSPALYNEYNLLERKFLKQVLSLGAQVVRHKGLEADDVLGYLCQKLKNEKIILVSRDKDLLVCAKYPNVNVYIQEQINPKLFGDFPYEYIDVYKATVGDPSDNIPGAKGFGPKAFEALYNRYGERGLKTLRSLIMKQELVKLEEDVPELPVLSKLINYEVDVEASLKCAMLYSDDVHKLEWEHGMCLPKSMDIHPVLWPYAQTVVGVTQENFEQVKLQLESIADETDVVALDIETSVPYESVQWLLAQKGKEGVGVDVLGSMLTGLSVTLGGNLNRTYYFSVDHKDTDNCSLEQVESVLKLLDKGCRFIIHNVNFELPVLYNTFGWFLRDVDDTKLMASYVDENDSLGLKHNSKRWLNYTQATYEETVRDADGKLRQMNELTLDEVLAYGSDDTICTAALYQWFKLAMELEGVFQTYRDVEIGAAYWVAQAFIDGVDISYPTLRNMTLRDEEIKCSHQEVLDQYLISQGWEGTQFLSATDETRSEASWVKYAFEVVHGTPLNTRVKKIERLAEACSEQGEPELAHFLLHGSLKELNDYVSRHFHGRPQFNVGSPKQMQQLMYEVMKLPIRLRNKPTDNMRMLNQLGSPQTDELAINTALAKDLKEDDPRTAALKALLGIKTINTREGLYYKTYPNFIHWKDGKVHASLNQCSTVTRRFSCSSPNLQQLAKGKGDFRKIFVPHHRDAMIVSLDFSAQELRLIAEQSQDPNMLACYVGDNLKDMHALTGAGIAKMPYDEFKAILDDENHEQYKWAKKIRAVGKTVNFASAYGAAAGKMSQTLMCSEDEAQKYLDAKFSTFSVTEDWKRAVEKAASKQGYVETMLGARRHLDSIKSADSWEVKRAERQAVNFKIQGSGAEMTKLAMGRMWFSNLRNRYDIRFFAPIHDEVVFSIAIKDMPRAIPEIHAAMTAQYADMAVPIESSVSFGPNFGEQHEMGDGVRPTPENVQAMLDQLLAA